MTLNISINSSKPANTYCVMGSLGVDSFYIDLTTSSDEYKTIVSDFISLFGANITIEISNYDIDVYFEANIIIPGDSTLDVTSVNYVELTTEQQHKIDMFVNLVTTNLI